MQESYAHKHKYLRSSRKIWRCAAGKPPSTKASAAVGLKSGTPARRVRAYSGARRMSYVRAYSAVSAAVAPYDGTELVLLEEPRVLMHTHLSSVQFSTTAIYDGTLLEL